MAELKIKADSGGGTVSFKGPATTTSNAAVQLTLPVDDGTSGQYLKTDGSGALSWATVAVGGATGTDYNDSVNVRFGTDNDMQIKHNGTDASIANNTGNLYIQTADSSITMQLNNGEKLVKAIADGAVELYHDNTKQCETSANGLAFPSGKGIDFSATGDAGGMASELFDDYEEGTWTPTAGSGSDIALNNPVGVYTKIGNVVHVQCYFSSTSAGTMAVNDSIQVEGIPFSRDSNVIPPAMIQINYNSTNGSIIAGCTVNTTPAITGRIGVTTGHNRSGPGYQVSATYRVA